MGRCWTMSHQGDEIGIYWDKPHQGNMEIYGFEGIWLIMQGSKMGIYRALSIKGGVGKYWRMSHEGDEI